MTIKDIELRSGMTRANIRYYESLGLLSPARGENGYRDYSETDLVTLLKIKLLRSLEVSLEDIGALSRGEKALGEVLARQMDTLELKEQELTQARELCRQMQSDAVDYQSLDAEHYLDLMRSRSEAMALAREKDKIHTAAVPFRRFFARSLDEAIYVALIDLLLLACGVNIGNLSSGIDFLIAICGFLLMFFIEPLLLHTWGSTPGKWIMGLYIRCYDGSKPDYYEGMYRNWDLLRYGYGFGIPFYSLYRHYKSLEACGDGEMLPWEDDCYVIEKDAKPLRWLGLVGAHALRVGIVVLAALLVLLPNHRGEISTAEYVDNFNDMCRFLDYMDDYQLTEKGVFEQCSNTVTISLGFFGYPRFDFHEENGVLEGFTMYKEHKVGHNWLDSYANYISIASQSFIYARTGGMLSNDLKEMIDFLNEHPFEDFTFNVRGYTLSADYEYKGYSDFGDMLVPDEGAEECHYSMVFAISPQK